MAQLADRDANVKIGEKMRHHGKLMDCYTEIIFPCWFCDFRFPCYVRVVVRTGHGIVHKAESQLPSYDGTASSVPFSIILNFSDDA